MHLKIYYIFKHFRMEFAQSHGCFTGWYEIKPSVPVVYPFMTLALFWHFNIRIHQCSIFMVYSLFPRTAYILWPDVLHRNIIEPFLASYWTLFSVLLLSLAYSVHFRWNPLTGANLIFIRVLHNAINYLSWSWICLHRFVHFIIISAKIKCHPKGQRLLSGGWKEALNLNLGSSNA